MEDGGLLTCCSPQPSWRIPPETRVRPGRRWRLTGRTATQAHGSLPIHTRALLGRSAYRPSPPKKTFHVNVIKVPHTGSVSFNPSSHLLNFH